MDNNSSSTEAFRKYLASPSIRITMCPAKFAVRVSKVEEREQRPHIDELLNNYGYPIFFVCTHYKGASPTITNYPKNGTIGEKYHRLGLSLDEMLRDCVLYIQICIEVARTDEEKEHWSQRDDYEVLDTSEENPLIFYDEETQSWYCNDYSDCTKRYFVYLVFGPGLQPTYEGFWDTVMKTN
ncbi:unnamed protein product [Auanema sp. JU1783]|nr:unnamed protein product [Auanema sp. JU1783]